MRNMIAALAVGVMSVGFAVSAQAAPATGLAPLTTLAQSSIEQVQYGHNKHRKCHKVRHCHGHGYHRKCHYVTKCHGGH